MTFPPGDRLPPPRIPSPPIRRTPIQNLFTFSGGRVFKPSQRILNPFQAPEPNTPLNPQFYLSNQHIAYVNIFFALQTKYTFAYFNSFDGPHSLLVHFKCIPNPIFAPRIPPKKKVSVDIQESDQEPIFTSDYFPAYFFSIYLEIFPVNKYNLIFPEIICMILLDQTNKTFRKYLLTRKTNFSHFHFVRDELNVKFIFKVR